MGPGLQGKCSQALDADAVEQWHYIGHEYDDAVTDTEATIIVDKRSIEAVTESLDLTSQVRTARSQILSRG
ncbi:hypothetical protein MTY59_17960 [Mycobacterium senriense]|uniref:Uncharacterized protein n=1 Tax=Mycobacterium senriense TaxID=2775496 RepID=A0ABM7SQ82_9MYCO|nr:hypothetical protein MTY59_17960 [Mycobacterium senriense]